MTTSPSAVDTSRAVPAAPTVLRNAVVGAVFIAASGLWVALADVPPAAAAFFRCAYALPVLLWLARREAAPTTPRARWMGLVAGLCFTGDLVLWHSSIELVGAGLATVLGAGQVVVVPLVSWLLLKERPSGRVLGSLPVLVVGVVVIAGVGGGAYGSSPVLGTVFGAGAGVAYAGFLLALRQANVGGSRPAAALRDATATGVVGTAVVAVLGGHTASLVPAWPSTGWLLVLALGSQVIAWLLITSSLPHLPAAVTSVILTLQPMVSVVLGVVVLHERPSPVQVAGVLLVLAAVTHATGARFPRRIPQLRPAA